MTVVGLNSERTGKPVEILVGFGMMMMMWYDYEQLAAKGIPSMIEFSYIEKTMKFRIE